MKHHLVPVIHRLPALLSTLFLLHLLHTVPSARCQVQDIWPKADRPFHAFRHLTVNDGLQRNAVLCVTQGGKNSGDLIIFKSQIRTYPNAHFDTYKNNQTFQIFRDADCTDSIVYIVNGQKTYRRR